MTQNQINREVAKATGETVKCIRQLGFDLVIVPEEAPDREVDAAETNPSEPIVLKQQPRAAA